jgi:DNA repair exonuclease SbcCD ATPase subunit
VRLKEVTLSGFRAFGRTTTVNLNADCVVISGANGQGKTSLLDGIFWVLTGRLDRLGADDKLVSLYSETGGASVALTLDADGGDLVLTRRYSGERTTLNATLAGTMIEGDELRRRFGRLVLLPSDLNLEDNASFTTALARSLYLQQDSIRDFIKGDSDDARFRVVAELFGLGRVTDLQATLQQERKAWTQATNQFEAQLTARRARLSDLRARAAKLGEQDIDLETLPSIWAEWWTSIKDIVPSFVEPRPDVNDPTSDAVLDRAVRLLEGARLEAQRRQDALKDAVKIAKTLLAGPTKEASDIWKGRVRDAEQAEAEARKALRAAEEQNVATEQHLLASRASDRELRTLAELALRHLGDRCPVCDQTFDRDSTIHRLKDAIASSPAGEAPLTDLSGMVETLAGLQRQTLVARTALRESEADAARLEQLRSEFQRRLSDLGLTDQRPETGEPELQRLSDSTAARVALIDSVRRQADQLSLLRARAGESAQRQEIARQLETAEKDVTESERTLASRERAGRVAASISEEMREASLQIVENELRRIEPLFQRIWAGIDPHPSLRAVQLISRLSYGKGRLSMRVRDDIGEVATESPEAVLSSSQQNALAVALFLTLNLGTQTLPLATTVLDDPFQSLDDINLLGLVDVLRRIPGSRQLIVTTHEHRFAQLLARKLRPIDEHRTTKLIEFDSWDRTAPLVTERELVRETSPFRFVA